MIIVQREPLWGEAKNIHREHDGWVNYLVVLGTGYMSYHYLGKKSIGKKLVPDRFHFRSNRITKITDTNDPTNPDLGDKVYSKATEKDLQEAHQMDLFYKIIKDVFKAGKTFARGL